MIHFSYQNQLLLSIDMCNINNMNNIYYGHNAVSWFRYNIFVFIFYMAIIPRTDNYPQESLLLKFFTYFNKNVTIRLLIKNENMLTTNWLLISLIHCQLSPKCSDLLLKCRWEDREVDCNKTFQLRRTSEGYCCSYNYIRPRNVLSPDRLWQLDIEEVFIYTERSILI